MLELLSLLTGLLGMLESSSLALLSGVIEESQGLLNMVFQFQFVADTSLTALGLSISIGEGLLGWLEGVSGPLHSGLVECSLGLNALLGGGGGGENGLGSSGFDVIVGISINTELLGGNSSGGIVCLSLGEFGSSSSLGTSKWGNLCSQILEEGGGLGEVISSLAGFSLSEVLPSHGSIAVLLGGSKLVSFAGLDSFSCTNDSL